MNPGPILIGLSGTELDSPGREHLSHPAVGGVVLFSRNFSNRKQLESLVGEIRKARASDLLIAIDQEGGRVQRLRDGFTCLPPLGTLGRLHASDPLKALDMAYRHARVMATEMLACDIDLSFAPVLDLNRGSSVIGDRAFSAHPDTVIELGRSYLAGMSDSGMKTTGKHFPGHGSVRADSHIGDVSDPRSLAEIEHSDLRPFRELSTELDALMIAHVVYPVVDELPAGYSGEWLINYLRGDMAYSGVIISDDLGMHAARAVGGLQTRTRRCLEAGCDLVLVCRPEDVTALLSELKGSLGDASQAIASLLGRPTVNRDELAAVRREGIREWQFWQQSLERLGEQTWS
jgi:beta-N-acetylhexosaminidase